LDIQYSFEKKMATDEFSVAILPEFRRS